MSSLCRSIRRHRTAHRRRCVEKKKQIPPAGHRYRGRRVPKSLNAFGVNPRHDVWRRGLGAFTFDGSAVIQRVRKPCPDEHAIRRVPRANTPHGVRLLRGWMPNAFGTTRFRRFPLRFRVCVSVRIVEKPSSLRPAVWINERNLIYDVISYGFLITFNVKVKRGPT